MAEDWERYARAVIASMREVLAEAEEKHHPLPLETADYWLSVGATLGLSRPGDARRLLATLERAKNVILGRALGRAGLWRALWR